jgi:hypothetical protein
MLVILLVYECAYERMSGKIREEQLSDSCLLGHNRLDRLFAPPVKRDRANCASRLATRFTPAILMDQRLPWWVRTSSRL